VHNKHGFAQSKVTNIQIHCDRQTDRQTNSANASATVSLL